MLAVKAYLAPSHVHGIGLFAGEDIEKGGIVWKFTPRVDLIYTPRQLLSICRSMDGISLRDMASHIYKRNNRYFYLSDNTRFINHTDEDYNVMLIDDLTEIAIKDIREGEELLENYGMSYDTDDPFFYEINNICMDRFLAMNARERRRIVKGQVVSG